MSSRKLVIARRALTDLEDAWEYVAATATPEIARKLTSEILDAFERLANMPGMGHRRSDVVNPDYRFWTVKSYVIAYRYNSNAIHISRVLHGSRDFTKIPF